MLVFGCSSHPKLSKNVCEILGITQGNMSIKHPTNKETDVRVSDETPDLKSENCIGIYILFV